jgi:hypothetical protein
MTKAYIATVLAAVLLCSGGVAQHSMDDDWQELRRHRGSGSWMVEGGRVYTSFDEALASPREVVTLVLTNQNLGALPPEIGQFTNLRQLSLYRNNLTTLPATIGTLTNLCILDASYNDISSLPDDIGNLSSLLILDLNFNPLESLPEEIGQLKRLRRLYLWGNGDHLKRIPQEIGALSDLQLLELDANTMTSIPSEIGSLTGLRELAIYAHRIERLPPELGKLTELRSLSLEVWTYSLPQELRGLTNLVNVFVDNRHLTRRVSTHWPGEWPHIRETIPEFRCTNTCTGSGSMLHLDIVCTNHPFDSVVFDVYFDGRRSIHGWNRMPIQLPRGIRVLDVTCALTNDATFAQTVFRKHFSTESETKETEEPNHERVSGRRSAP